jgi:hypothetical protein
LYATSIALNVRVSQFDERNPEVKIKVDVENVDVDEENGEIPEKRSSVDSWR